MPPEFCDRPEFSRNRPGPESELLYSEIPASLPQLHGRALAMLEASVDRQVMAIPPGMLEKQSFVGLSFVAIIASLHELDGQFAQCGWFDKDDMDWFWVEITDVRSIVLRQDPRFRGGTPCLWMSTNFAEYAMITSHVTYDEHWERTLEYFRAPRCDMWPRNGLRPDWWPLQWLNAWPYDRSAPAQYDELEKEDSLGQLTQNLSLGSGSSPTAWLRLGPKGEVQLLGQPSNRTGQSTEWSLAQNAGIKKTRNDGTLGDENMDGSSGKGTGKRKHQSKSKGKAEGKQTWLEQSDVSKRRQNSDGEWSSYAFV